jgi:hypothetical protein
MWIRQLFAQLSLTKTVQTSNKPLKTGTTTKNAQKEVGVNPPMPQKSKNNNKTTPKRTTKNIFAVAVATII